MTRSVVTSAAERGPGARSRLAAALRDARSLAGLSGAEAGRRAGMSQSKVSKIERGFLLPTVDDVAALSRAFDLDAGQRDDLVGIASALREESSAKVVLARGASEMQRRIGRLESASTTLRSFSLSMVIGLLQTPAYVRCVFDVPNSQLRAAEDIDAAVAARADRQRVLADASKRFVLIMTEGALRWQAGSPDLMAEQVDFIAKVARRRNVRIGLIPWTKPVTVFPLHNFHLYDEDAAVVGTQTATATMTGAADVATYVELFAKLEAAAVFGRSLQTHLTRIADDYRQL